MAKLLHRRGTEFLWRDFLLSILYFPLVVLTSIPMMASDFESGGLEYIILDNQTCSVSGYSYLPEDGILIIPSEVRNFRTVYQVVSIERNVFNSAYSLKSVTLPNTLKELKGGAFCMEWPDTPPQLEEVNLNEGLEIIGPYCFDAPLLKNITLPSTLKRIENGAFDGCSIEEIVIPESVEFLGLNILGGNPLKIIYYNAIECYTNNKIGEYTFWAFDAHFVIGPKVKRIPAYLFFMVGKNSDIIIPESVEYIGHEAFSASRNNSIEFYAKNCKEIEGVPFYTSSIASVNKLIIGEKVENLPSGLFKGLHSITEVVIPESVKTIGSNVFEGCSSLNTVYFNGCNTTYIGDEYSRVLPSSVSNLIIGDKVRTIPANIALGVKSLSEIEIPNSVTTIDQSAFYYSGIHSISYSEALEFIGNNAFEGTAITNGNLPSSLLEIGREAFYSTPLESLQLPVSLKKIDSGAFAECTILDINVVNPNPIEIDKSVFDDEVYENATVHFPYGSVGKYERTPSWNEFKKYRTAGTETICLEEIIIDPQFCTIEEESSIKLNPSFSPLNAVDKSVEWISSDESVAIVSSDGIVTGVHKGETIISVYASNGSDIKGQCIVSVTEKEIQITAISLSVTSISIFEGEKLQLTPIIEPENYTGNTIIWESNEDSVAIVDSEGTVTGLKQGTATITAKTNNGLFACCTVSVMAQKSDPFDINGDTKVNVSDVVSLVSMILSKTYDPAIHDLNNDTKVTVSDIVVLVNHILNSNGQKNLPSRSGATTEVPVSFGAMERFTAMQTDIVVADGVTIEDVVINPAIARSHSLAYNEIEPGRYRLIVYSAANRVMSLEADSLCLRSPFQATTALKPRQPCLSSPR